LLFCAIANVSEGDKAVNLADNTSIIKLFFLLDNLAKIDIFHIIDLIILKKRQEYKDITFKKIKKAAHRTATYIIVSTFSKKSVHVTLGHSASSINFTPTGISILAGNPAFCS